MSKPISSISISPFIVDSSLHSMGVTDLQYLDGRHYTEYNLCLHPASYGEYCLHYDEHEPAKRPSGLSFCYVPDMYCHLKDSVKASAGFSDYPHVASCKSTPLIHVEGGYDAYLNRLTSKKRSALKKIDTEGYNYACIDDWIDIGQALEREYNRVTELHESFTEVTDRFSKFSTHLAPVFLAQGILVGALDLPHLSSNGGVFLVATYKEDGSLYCNTLCISQLDSYVLHPLIDIDKCDDYSCKVATLHNIKYATLGGYSYVDIGNNTLTEAESATDWGKRLIYKQAFYTSSGCDLPMYFSDDFGFANYQKSLETVNEEEV